MALGIYLGGTTGAADGTLEVPGDGTGLVLGAVGSVGTIHIRAASGKRNAEQVTVNAPTDCEVSADGTTYGATAVYAVAAIEDVNVPIYVKRVSGTAASTTGGTTTPRLALITEEVIPVPDTTAPVIAGTLTATPTAVQGQVTLSGPTATDNVGIAKWQYQVDSGAWVDVASISGTFPSTNVSSLAVGSHDFAVRAVDAASNTSATKTASATITPPSLNITADIEAVATTIGGTGARRLTRLADGTLLVAYEDNNTTTNPFIGRSTNDGTTWTNTNIRPATTYIGGGGSVAAGSGATAFAAFSGESAGDAIQDIYFATSSDSGATWVLDNSGAYVFGDPTAEGRAYPSIAVDANNDVHMVWMNNTNTTVYYAKRTAGTWGTAEVVYTGTANAATRPRPMIVIAPNGDLWCTYAAWNGTYHQILVEKRGATAWDSTPIAAYQGSTVAYSPQIEFDVNGYLHLSYELVEGGSSKFAIKYQRSTDLTSFSTAITLSDEPTYDQRNAQFGLDASGNVTMLWGGSHSGSTTYTQISKRTSSGDPTNISNWGTVEHITSDSINASTPQVLTSYFPQVSGDSVNIPAQGFAMVYMAGAYGTESIKYVASDLVWQ